MEITENQKEILQQAINKYGSLAQCDMIIEECSELIKAILKNRRNSKEDTLINIREEIADVFIMINQAFLIFEKDGKIQKEIDFKISRLNSKINNFSESEI